MTAGFLAPRERSKGCVSQSVRLPPELRGYVKSVIAKFGVKPNGQPYAFSLLGEIPQEIRSRMESAVWQAVASCDWAAGADAQGKPIAIYVMLPLRFAQ
jgi:protein TonB